VHGGHHIGEVADREDAGVRRVAFFVAMTQEAAEAAHMISTKAFHDPSTAVDPTFSVTVDFWIDIDNSSS
jgi:hypothetical protein